MKWNWGTGIATTYIVFAAATSGFVVFAMNRPVSLVRPDYYAASLRQDEQMAARARAQQLGAAVSITAEARDVLTVRVPMSAATPITGTVTMYRASDPAADRTFTFAPDPHGAQELVKVTKRPDGTTKEERLCAVRFVPLIGEEGWRDD